MKFVKRTTRINEDRDMSTRRMSDGPLIIDDEEGVTIDEDLRKSNTKQLMNAISANPSEEFIIISDNTNGREIVNKKAYDEAKKIVEEKKIATQVGHYDGETEDSYVIKGDVSTGKQLAGALCQEGFIHIIFKDDENLTATLYETDMEDDNTRYVEYTKTEDTDKIKVDNSFTDYYSEINGIKFKFCLYTKFMDDEEIDSYRNLDEDKIKESSTSFKKAFKNGGDDSMDYITGKAIARVKDKNERDRLVALNKIEKSGRLGDRKSVEKELGRKFKQADSDYDNKAKKFVAKKEQTNEEVLNESKWEYVVKAGAKLYYDIDNVDEYLTKEDFRKIKEDIKACYKELFDNGYIDEYDYNEYTEEVDDVIEDEVEIDFLLENLYDLCDNINVFLSVDNYNESLKEDKCPHCGKDIPDYHTNKDSEKGTFERTLLADGHKYRLQKEYDGFGIYQRITSSGYRVSQDYAFTNGKITVISPSYNYNNIEDIMDIIDNYNKTGKLGVKVYNNDGIKIIHPSGVKESVNEKVDNYNKYNIKIWETEDDRNHGEPFSKTFVGTENQVKREADKLYNFNDYSTLEVEDINGKVIYGRYSEEEIKESNNEDIKTQIKWCETVLRNPYGSEATDAKANYGKDYKKFVKQDLERFRKMLNNKKEIKESKQLNESTPNFSHNKYLPLLVFNTYDELLDAIEYDSDYPKKSDFEDYDEYIEACEEFEEKYLDTINTCILTDEDIELLKNDIDKFNTETQKEVNKLYDLDVNEDGYQEYGEYYDDAQNLEYTKVDIDSGYYSGVQLTVTDDGFDYLSNEVKEKQIERFKKFFNDMKKKYHLTELNVDGVFSNGEAVYSIKKDESLKEAKEDDDKKKDKKEKDEKKSDKKSSDKKDKKDKDTKEKKSSKNKDDKEEDEEDIEIDDTELEISDEDTDIEDADIVDEPIINNTEENEVDDEMKTFSLETLVRDTIEQEWGSIENLNSLIYTIKSQYDEIDEDIINVLEDIVDDKKKQLGKLNVALKLTNPDDNTEELMNDGIKDIEDLISLDDDDSDLNINLDDIELDDVNFDDIDFGTFDLDDDNVTFGDLELNGSDEADSVKNARAIDVKINRISKEEESKDVSDDNAEVDFDVDEIDDDMNIILDDEEDK